MLGTHSRHRFAAAASALALAAGVAAAGTAPARAAEVYDRQLTATTGLFLVNGPDHAAAQQFATAGGHVGRLLDHRNTLGELPEQIDPAGHPASVVPLAWTGAVTLLALTQLDGHPLPVPPVRCAPPARGRCPA